MNARVSLARPALLVTSLLSTACGARASLPDGSPSTGAAGCARAVEAPAVCPMGAKTLVTGRNPVTLRVDATHVVYTTSPGGGAGPVSLLEAVPLEGGDRVTLYTFAPDANEMAWTLRGGAVYLNDTQGHIVRVPVDGSAQSILHTAPLPFRAWHFDADDAFLYWGERDNKAGTERVYRMPLEGGTPEQLAEIDFTWGYPFDTSPSQDVELTTDGCSVYWLHKTTIPMNGGSNGDGVIYRVDASGGSPVPLLEGLAQPRSLTPGAGALWVVDDAQSPFHSDARFTGAGEDGSARATISFPTYGLATFVIDRQALDYVLYDAGSPGGMTGWWTRPLDGSGTPSLIDGIDVGVQVYGAVVDPACRILYLIEQPDLVRSPLP